MDGAIRVLHVDDDSKFAELTATVLERENDRFAVETATSVDEGLDHLDDDVDCIISDYDIPDRTGLEFLETVRETYPSLPFILFTGKGSEEVASEAISSGVTNYLQKERGTDQYTVLANRVANVVERARAKADARRARARFESLAEALPDVVFYIDADGRFLDVLAGTESPLVYGETESLVGRRFRDVLPAGTADRLLETVRRALETGDLQTVEYEVDGRTGRQWFEARVAPLEPTAPERDTVLWVARDVTDRKERERELSHKSGLLDSIFESVPVHLFVKDERARHVRVSAGFVEEPEQFIGRTDLEIDLVSDAHARSAYTDDLRVIETGDPILNKVEHLPKYDQWNLTSKVPWRDADGEIVGLIGISWDITDQKEREQLLERQNERLEEFASIVSHDLRNPLTVARGRLNLAMEECESDHLSDVAWAIDRSQTLVEDLRTLASDGDHVGELVPVALTTLSEHCWRTVVTPGATLVTATDATIRADRSRLLQLFENLFRNAVEHGSTSPRSHAREDAVEHSSTSPDSQARQDAVEHGSTSPRSHAREDSTERSSASGRPRADDAVEHGGDDVTVTVGDLDGGFYVEDDGTGIPADEREDVFEVGYSTADDGTGFGLNIVEQVVDAHDWEVRVTESDVGGARFEITGVEIVE